MRKSKGITPIMSVVILIGIAVVGGLFLNAISQQFSSSALTTLKYSVNDLRIEKSNDGACFFSVNLYNSGTVPVQKTTIKTTLDNGEDWAHEEFNGTKTIIVPKEELSKVVTFDGNDCGNFTTGNTYSMFINASSTESSFSTIKSIKIKEIEKP